MVGRMQGASWSVSRNVVRARSALQVPYEYTHPKVHVSYTPISNSWPHVHPARVGFVGSARWADRSGYTRHAQSQLLQPALGHASNPRNSGSQHNVRRKPVLRPIPSRRPKRSSRWVLEKSVMTSPVSCSYRRRFGMTRRAKRLTNETATRSTCPESRSANARNVASW